jgi:hypothetical protein
MFAPRAPLTPSEISRAIDELGGELREEQLPPPGPAAPLAADACAPQPSSVWRRSAVGRALS